MNSLFFDSVGISLPQFYNENTLNIFCDASIVGKPGHFTGCYGVVAVVGDTIIDSRYRIASNSTSNNSEVKGLRAAIDLAIKYMHRFAYINIFSDSQISVFGLRDYIYKWRYNPKDNLLYTSMNKPVVNQNIFLECHYMLMESGLCNKVRIFHQSGHVNNGYEELKDAANVFRKSNNIIGNIDLNFIRYISTYNNYVDKTSRSLLKRSNLKLNYCDPISFDCRGRVNRF